MQQQLCFLRYVSGSLVVGVGRVIVMIARSRDEWQYTSETLSDLMFELLGWTFKGDLMFELFGWTWKGDNAISMEIRCRAFLETKWVQVTTIAQRCSLPLVSNSG